MADLPIAASDRSQPRCKLCGLRTQAIVCDGCADRLEVHLQQNPTLACRECGRHQELCSLRPCKTGSGDQVDTADSAAIVWLPITIIDEQAAGQNSRRRYNEAAIRELAASLRQHGFLQPLCVRPTGSRYELIFGARRLRAAVEAGMNDVPCVIRAAGDDRAFLLNAIENLQRQQLSGRERVQIIERLAATGLGIREISRQTGFNPSTISRWLRLNRIAELKAALEQDRIDVARAVVLIDAPESALANLMEQAPSLSVSELRRLVASLKPTQRPVPVDDQEEHYLTEALRCLRAVQVADKSRLLERIRREVERLSKQRVASPAPAGRPVRIA